MSDNPTSYSAFARVWTVGHSTRSIEEFVALLAQNSIALLADVRLLPGSRRYPHFNATVLAGSLREHRIRYEHFPELGGRRKPRPDSLNTVWRNDSFRGYADHMETPEFAEGIARLLELASATGPAAIMCAEAVWWRCHRALVSDYLKVRGVEVIHILNEHKNEPHPFTSAAQVLEGRLSYACPA
ncbi:MAG: DUF488 domain-containing protein [Chthoniobacterales bacterium]|nr:DUF488 domain-containing protein [Chthoniobacterales bacterium]